MTIEEYYSSTDFKEITLKEAIDRKLLPHYNALPYNQIFSLSTIEYKQGNTVLTKKAIEIILSSREYKIYKANKEVQKYHTTVSKTFEELEKDLKSMQEEMRKAGYKDDEIAKIGTIFSQVSEIKKENSGLRFKTDDEIREYADKIFQSKSKTAKVISIQEEISSREKEIKEKIAKIDEIRRENAKSKFKKMIDGKKIERIEKSVEKLRQKNGIIVDKQTRIIAKENSKYIHKVMYEREKYEKRKASLKEYLDTKENIKTTRNNYNETLSANNDDIKVLQGKKGIVSKIERFYLERQNARLESKLKGLNRKEGIVDLKNSIRVSIQTNSDRMRERLEGKPITERARIIVDILKSKQGIVDWINQFKFALSPAKAK